MKLIYTLCISLFCTFASAQVPDFHCGFDAVLNSNPAYKDAVIKQTLAWKNLNNRLSSRRDFQYNYDTIYEVKVVFHILWNQNIDNIPDSTILSQIEVMNEDFQRLNRDSNSTRGVFKPVAGKMKIKFVLATQDPNGNPTNGINRKFTNITAFSQTDNNSYDTRMKYNSQGGQDAWNTEKYLNIWVCDMYPAGASSFTAGYATPPEEADYWNIINLNFPAAEQGVAIHYYTIGRYNSAATANNAFGLGRTLVHELGHYFGLFHIWGTQLNTCNKSIDDYIDDTPNTQYQASRCNIVNSCNDGAGDLPDPIENYMDYSFGSCQNMFTHQQVSLMKFNINNYRQKIYSPIILKDSIELPNIDGITPMIFNNPGDVLTIGANKYASSKFKLSIYDNIGRVVIKDLEFSLSSPTAFEETATLQDGNYIVKINQVANNKEFILRWSKGEN